MSDDHHEAADVLGQRELPADQHPQDEPELPHEVRRRELEGERRDGRRALLEERLADRDRGVGARRGRGAEAGRPERAAAGLRPPAPTRCARRGTHACTIAEIANPSTSAHHTSHAIRKRVLAARRRSARSRSSSRVRLGEGRARPRSACPFSVSVYMVILPFRRERTTPWALSAFMWCDTRFCGRSAIHERSHTHSSWPSAERQREREAGRLAERAVAAGQALGVVKRRAARRAAAAPGPRRCAAAPRTWLHTNIC